MKTPSAATLCVIISLFLIPEMAMGIEPPVLRMARESEPASLDWNRNLTQSDRFIVSLLMRGLLKYQEGTTKLVCDLCQTYSVSADRLTYKFKIRGDEEWSDGMRLDAAQFVESFRRLQGNSALSEDFRMVQTYKAIGKDELEIKLKYPSTLFLHLLTTAPSFPIRKEFLRDTRGETHALQAVLGPYQLAAWEHGKRIVLEGNPKFRGDRPVYRVDIAFGNHQELFKDFKTGRLDLFDRPTTEEVTALMSAGERQRIEMNPYWATRLLYFNSKKKPVSELGIRRAILYALDRENFPSYLKNGERKVTGVIPPGLSGYRELALMTRDLNQAQVERKAFGSGPIQIRLLIPDRAAMRKTAQWLSEQLENIGIRLKVSARGASEYSSALAAGEFDLALGTWVFAVANPIDFLRTFQTGSKLNRGHWSNVAFDDVLAQIFEKNEAEDLSGLLDQATQILETRNVGVIPLGFPTQPYFLGPRVTRFAITPFGEPDLIKIDLKK